jgi:OOP family OmpA-OmpF porin
MNKPQFLAALALASLASTGAMAQAYVSGSVGAGHIDVDCSGATQCDNNGSAARVALGWNLGFGLSAEVGYLNFGKATASGSVGGFPVGTEYKTGGLMVGGAFSMPIAPFLSLNARLGVANLKTTLTATSGSVSADDSTTKSASYAGLGLGFHVAPNVRIEAAVDSSQANYQGDKASVRAVTVGVRASF